MARRASVRYYKSRNAYYTHFRGQQIKLAAGADDYPDGPVYRAAIKRFLDLVGLASAPTAGAANTVKVVCELYARHLEEQGRVSSLKIFLEATRPAVEVFGHKPVAELIPYDVTSWLAAMGEERRVTLGKPAKGGKRAERVVSWGETMKAMGARSLRTAFNWAKSQGIIPSHRLSDRGAIDFGRGRCRGDEACVPDADVPRILDAAPRALRDLLRLLAGTGCRPGEACNVEAHNYSAADRAIVFRWNATRGYIHKNAKKTRRDRIIYLTDELAELVSQLAAEHPTGPLFLNHWRKSWAENTYAAALRRMRKALGLAYPLTAYSFRHTYATRFLRAGGSIKLLADCLGNSVRMIELHYGHLAADRGAMRNQLLAVMGEGN